MPRSPLQPGPETHHYHDTLGVDEQPGGGVQTVSLLGPFHYVYTDFPGNGDSHAVVALIPGSVVLAVSVIPRDTWASSPGTAISAALGIVTATLGLFWLDDDNGGSWPNPAVVVWPFPKTMDLALPLNVPTAFPSFALVEESTDLKIVVSWAGDPPASGSLDIYALIATPS